MQKRIWWLALTIVITAILFAGALKVTKDLTTAKTVITYIVGGFAFISYIGLLSLKDEFEIALTYGIIAFASISMSIFVQETTRTNIFVVLVVLGILSVNCGLAWCSHTAIRTKSCSILEFFGMYTLSTLIIFLAITFLPKITWLLS